MAMGNLFAQSPQLTVNRASITTSVANGGTTTQTFIITNTGNRDLTWNLETAGVPVTFTKPAYANWTLAANQDRVTPTVWITRQNNQGLFNIASQSAFNSTAPAGTTWAFGNSEDLEPGDYTTWQNAVDGDPQSMIGNVISMHTTGDNRYFDITFSDFSGSNSGGGFSYTRVEYNLQWIAADFSSGTLIPGQSKTVTLTFDADDLTSGNHSGLIVLESNDPINAEKTINLNLTVATAAGTAEIDAVTSKYLGDGYTNFASEKTVTINNLGTGMLNVTNVTSGNPAFIPETTSFSIAPGQGYDLPVMFMPTTSGLNIGNLTLTSNDSDESSFVIALSADAFGAPVSAVSSSTITKAMTSGSTSAQSFTISNTGETDLTYQLSFNLGTGTPVIFTKTDYADLTAPENQDQISADVVLTRNVQGGLYNIAAESSFDSNISPINTEWAPTSTATATSYSEWRDAMDGDPRSMIDVTTSMHLISENRYFDVVLRQWTCCENGGGFSYERKEIYNWLSTQAVTTGTIGAGASSTFDLDFNTAGLPAGSYNGTFTIKSNDPAAPLRNIPVSITVTGTPEARIFESTLAFNSTIVGVTSKKKIHVFNDGAAPLNVTGVTYSDNELSTYEATGTIAPFTMGYVEIAFTPSAVGTLAGNITLTTNDPANATIEIPYTAEGIAAGEINVIATDMNASVITGETVTKTITIENSGPGEIHWNAEMLNTNPIVTFEKADYADFKEAANQDRIAPGVWITRQDNRGLFNIAREENYREDESPIGTAWEPGSTFKADLGGYMDWGNAIDYDPLEAIDQTYSLHAANEYYDIVVRNWTSDNRGGGFSYERRKAAGWIKLDTYNGTVLPGESVDITVTYDPSDYLTASKNEILVISSDDPSQPTIQVPIELNIIGTALITTSVSEVDFGDTGLGFKKTLSVTLANEGTDVLNIGSIFSSNPAFTALPSSAMVPPNESVVINVDFTPGAVQSYVGQLQITSNAENESGLTIDLSGSGIQVPDIAVTPAQILLPTTTGTVFTGEIRIENNGAADLNWASGRPSAYPLSDVLSNLNSGFETITALVPNRYTFSYDGAQNYISDGGNDMYDDGNRINTNLASSINYSDNVIQAGDGLFGAGTSYFTRHLAGLFVMVADVNNITSFSTTGDNGADGNGSVSGAVLSLTLNGTQYKGFLKRVYGTSDPSINQLIILESDPSASHTFSTYSNDGQHEVTGLTNVKRVYYLVYAGSGGGYINDATAESIMNKFLTVISGGAGFLADWITLDTYEGTIAPGSAQTINYTVDLTSYPEANYTTALPIFNNDPDEGIVSIPVEINIGSVIVANEVTDIIVNEGFGSKVIDFSNTFVDGNNGSLTFAVGSDLQIVTGSITGTNLTLSETGTGTSIISLRAEDANNNVAYEDFNFRVNDIPGVGTPIEDIVELHGFASKAIDVSAVFIDNDEDDVITLSVSSSNTAVTTATIANGIITLVEGAVGTSTITLTANDGFGGISTETFTFTVNKATATLAAVNTNTTFDGTAKSVSITSTPANLSVIIVYSQNGAVVTSPTNAGTYTVVATINDANYQGTLTETLTINKATATLAATNNSTTFTGVAKSVAITTTPLNIPVTVSYSQSGAPVTSPTNAGVYDVLASVTDPNYMGSYAGILTINKADQLITFTALANVMNSNAPFALAATSTSGLAVSFAKVSGPITVSGTTVTLTGEVGDATIEAQQAGNANYNAATAVSRTFTITQDPVLSVDDALNAHVQAFPVPAKDYLNISTGTYSMNSVSLTDAFGRTVYSAEPNRTEHTIGTSTLSQGIYILRVSTQKGVVSRRVQVIE